MDLQMPEVDGFEATRRIRADERWATLPIIAVTAGAMIHDRDKCLAAGMNDFVVKPVQPAMLLEALLRHIPPRHSANEAGTTAPATDGSTHGAPAFAVNVPRLTATLHHLQQRINENEFIAPAELTELRQLTQSLIETRGAIATRIEAAIARYDYAAATKLIAGLLAALDAGHSNRSA
jgi:two-component system sensor histidine kinase/response regulator